MLDILNTSQPSAPRLPVPARRSLTRTLLLSGVLTSGALLTACSGTPETEVDQPLASASGTTSSAPVSTGVNPPSGTGSSIAPPATGSSVGVSPTASQGGPASTTSVPPVSTVDMSPTVVNPDINKVCPTSQLAEAPLRRLTRYEYANTVRDLLNVNLDVVQDFPPDEIVNGFSNNAQILSVGDLHIEKYTLGSEALAKEAVKNVTQLAPCTAGTAEATCALNFARSFGRRAFRRPIVTSDETMLMAAYNAGATGGSYAEGIEVMIRAALQSPNFVYRLEMTPSTTPGAKLIPLNGFELATRLSFTLWGMAPDNALLDAAQNDQLATKEQVAAKARTLLADPKARPALNEFYNQWLGTTKLASMTKSAEFFPNFNENVRAGMTAEMGAFVEYVMWTGDHKFSTLLTSPVAFATSALAGIYGVDAAGLGATPTQVTPPASQGRSGVLTQAGFLSVQAHPDQTSPVLRGKAVRTKLMCDPPKPPPDNVDITPPAPGEGATARDRLSLHLTAGSGCAGCHEAMDPIGFAFENFDATGQWREKENGVTINATGEIMNSTELAGEFVGVRALADKLLASEAVRDCVATQWFRFASGRTENEGDACTLATVQDAFAKSDGDLVELVVGLTQTDAFLNRAQAVEVTQ
jgi:Protein of unknown function (DUF1592)/Protein of unknown function (DUF1588)/Protein of unknown function (DUF1587)/Protein of unknown function (DUF1595)/Protein of unknown function (DUF1585)